MSIKITTGIFKGMNVEAPRTEGTRPTAARVREAVMNMLAPYFEDALVLDLFAGSGAVGLEAVSRGAKGCLFVENGRFALPALEKNLEEGERRIEKTESDVSLFELLPIPVEKALSSAASYGPFQIIWADPPYQDAVHWAGVLAKALPPLCAQEAIFAMETDVVGKKGLLKVMQSNPDWQLWKEKEYGDTCVTIFIKAERNG